MCRDNSRMLCVHVRLCNLTLPGIIRCLQSAASFKPGHLPVMRLWFSQITTSFTCATDVVSTAVVIAIYNPQFIVFSRCRIVTDCVHVQTADTELNSDVWSNSLTSSGGLQAAGSLDTLSCMSSQSAESPPLSLAKCMPSVVFEVILGLFFVLYWIMSSNIVWVTRQLWPITATYWCLWPVPAAYWCRSQWTLCHANFSQTFVLLVSLC